MTYSRSGSDSSFDSSNVIFVYGDDAASNPVIDDNKVRVLSEKVSYHIGEKARFLVRLPFSNGRVLVTVEKGSVLKREYRDVTGNMFFYELPIEESFAPNVYIGVVAIEPSSGKKVPEYRVGYAEVVVDKTDKKAFVTVVADKKEYKPREKVVLNLASKDLR
jgi:uncharacterized protein YfaS (alpha-2-macroglobulin family)